jgi:hypothetical protein
MKVVFGLIGILAAVVVVVVFLVFGSTTAPFDRHGEAAVGQVQNSLGDRYTVDTATLTSTWTFTRDTQVMLRFEDGAVTFDGADLQAGCYSDKVSEGDVLTFADAHHVSFASPDSDPSCGQLP